MNDVWIADTPPTREYSCPGCNKRVVCTRIGQGASYVVEHPDEKKGKGEEGEGKCKWKGFVHNRLIGYKPPKKEVSHDSAD